MINNERIRELVGEKYDRYVESWNDECKPKTCNGCGLRIAPDGGGTDVEIIKHRCKKLVQAYDKRRKGQVRRQPGVNCVLDEDPNHAPIPFDPNIHKIAYE